jgi:uncharacterized membrane protein YfcA
MQIFIMILIGIAGGAMSGLLGIGGGIVIIPMLVFVLGYTQYQAQAISLAAITAPVMLPAVWEYYRQGQLKVAPAIIIALAFVVGSFAGGALLRYIPMEAMKRVFGVLLLFMGVKFLLGR